MHCRMKEHLSKFNSKKEKIRSESAFFKHLENSHGGRDHEKPFSEYFDVQIMKAYRKAFTKCIEEGTYIASHEGEVLNSKSEWHQTKVIRTTTKVVQGGADVLRELGAQEANGVGQQGAGRQGAGGQGAGGQGAGGQGAGGQGAQGQGAGRQASSRRQSPRDHGGLRTRGQ